MTTILAIFSWLMGNKAIAGIVGAALALGGVWINGIRKGRAQMKAKQAAATARALGVRDGAEDAVAGRTAEENRKRLGKWVK